MSAKDRAVEIYKQHIELASTDGRLFRKTVMDQLMAELNISLASAATHYNHAKKAMPVEGLGRAPVSKNVVSPGKPGQQPKVQDDDECYTVMEIRRDGTVGRCQSFLYQGEAGEKFGDKTEAWPNSVWVMIKGLGPNSGDSYRLDVGEKELRRFPEPKAEVVS